MFEQLRPAIEALQHKLADQEREVNETKTLINRLCETAGVPILYPEAGAAGATMTAIRGDTFYGKSVTTAAREYLEMRKPSNLGPATPREIYEALKQGGYPFETADANNAMTGIRAVLRKNSAIFHRLPNGSWGLRAWYPRVKSERVSREVDDDENQSKADQETGAASNVEPPTAPVLRLPKPRAAGDK